jgi:hypothetical protein
MAEETARRAEALLRGAEDARRREADAAIRRSEEVERSLGRALHSSTFRLNLSAFCGIGGAFRGCLRGV